MKKQNVNWTMLCAATLMMGSVLFSGCNNGENSITGADENSDGQVALRVNSDIQTRAAGNQWSAQDAIGIYMVKTGTKTIAESATNRKYIAQSAAASSEFTPDGTSNIIYFPVDGSNVDFLLYYPQQSLMENVYAIDVTSQSNLPAIDLMTAKVTGQNKLVPAITPVFSHLLSKVELTIHAGEGLIATDLDNLEVMITKQRTQGSYNVLSEAMTITAGQNGADVTLNTIANGTKSEAILLPASDGAGINPIITGRQLTFTLQATGEVFKWNIPDEKQFAAGAKNIYDITINRTPLGLTATINDWTPGNGSGDSGSAE